MRKVSTRATASLTKRRRGGLGGGRKKGGRRRWQWVGRRLRGRQRLDLAGVLDTLRLAKADKEGVKDCDEDDSVHVLVGVRANVSVCATDSVPMLCV